MPVQERFSGKIIVKADGVVYRAGGAFSYNLGHDKRETIMGPDGSSVVKLTPQVPFIEGEVFDYNTFDITAVLDAQDVVVTLELANGKVISLAEAYFAGEGTVSTEESKLPVRWESGVKAEEIR